jgi:hypothetical protein
MESKMKNSLLLTLIILLLFVSPVFAGEADVIDVQVNKSGTRTYTFDVTISHKDTGWQHYANKWDIIDDKEAILGTRILHHPHVDEQPFTRSLSGVEIPENIKIVTIRAHDSVHGYGGKNISIKLP